MASPNPLVPDVEEELRLRLNARAVGALHGGQRNEAIAKYFPRDMVAVPVAQARSRPRRPLRQLPPRTATAARTPLTPQERQRLQVLIPAASLG